MSTQAYNFETAIRIRGDKSFGHSCKAHYLC